MGRSTFSSSNVSPAYSSLILSLYPCVDVCFRDLLQYLVFAVKSKLYFKCFYFSLCRSLCFSSNLLPLLETKLKFSFCIWSASWVCKSTFLFRLMRSAGCLSVLVAVCLIFGRLNCVALFVSSIGWMWLSERGLFSFSCCLSASSFFDS